MQLSIQIGPAIGKKVTHFVVPDVAQHIRLQICNHYTFPNAGMPLQDIARWLDGDRYAGKIESVGVFPNLIAGNDKDTVVIGPCL